MSEKSTIPQRALCDECGEPGELDNPLVGGTHMACSDQAAEALPDAGAIIDLTGTERADT